MKLRIYYRRESIAFLQVRLKKKKDRRDEISVLNFPLNSLLFFPQIMTAHECPLSPLAKILLDLAKHCFPKSEKFEARKQLLSMLSLTIYVRTNAYYLPIENIHMIEENEVSLPWLPSFAVRSPTIHCFQVVSLVSPEMKLIVKRKRKKLYDV